MLLTLSALVKPEVLYLKLSREGTGGLSKSILVYAYILI
jgi:hypothetical protein